MRGLARPPGAPSRTEDPRRYTQERLREIRKEAARHPGGRPQTRAECPTERPCQHTGCRYHLPTACALDMADEGPHTLAEVADLLGISRERVRQIEATACRRLVVLHGRSALVDLLSRADATGYDLPPDPGS